MSVGEAEGGSLWQPEKNSLPILPSSKLARKLSVTQRKLVALSIFLAFVLVSTYYWARNIVLFVQNQENRILYEAALANGESTISWSQFSWGFALMPLVLGLIFISSFTGYRTISQLLSGVPKWEKLAMISIGFQIFMLLSIISEFFFSPYTPLDALRDAGAHVNLIYSEDDVSYYGVIGSSGDIYQVTVSTDEEMLSTMTIPAELSAELSNATNR